MTDRKPPHDDAAEAGLLGCCMMEPRQCIPACVDKGIKESSFYNLKHAVVWTTMVGLMEKDGALDLITVQQALQKQGRLEMVGGIGGLMTLSDSVPSAANVVYYIDIILDHESRRSLLKVSAEMERMAFGPEPAVKSVDAASQMLVEIGSDRSDELPTPKELVLKVIDNSSAAMQGTRVMGLTTGLKPLDNSIPGGLSGGKMFCIAGRPSACKTMLAIQFANHIAANHGPVQFFSLETGAEEITARRLALESRVDLRSILDGKLTEADIQAMTTAAGRISRSPLWVDDRAGVGIAQIRARTRRAVLQRGVVAVVIDYLQLVAGSRAAMTDLERITEVSIGIKTLARQLKISIFALVQMNREIEKDKPRRPRMSDLRGCGQIEADADIIGALWCDKPDDELADKSFASVTLSLLKQKDGPLDDFPLVALKNKMRLEPRYNNDHIHT